MTPDSSHTSLTFPLLAKYNLASRCWHLLFSLTITSCTHYSVFFKKIFLIHLFWLRRVLVAACGIFFLVAARTLLSCGIRTLSCSMHAGSSSLTRDWTWAPCIGSTESYPLDHQGHPPLFSLNSRLPQRGFSWPPSKSSYRSHTLVHFPHSTC